MAAEIPSVKPDILITVSGSIQTVQTLFKHRAQTLNIEPVCVCVCVCLLCVCVCVSGVDLRDSHPREAGGARGSVLQHGPRHRQQRRSMSDPRVRSGPSAGAAAHPR